MLVCDMTDETYLPRMGDYVVYRLRFEGRFEKGYLIYVTKALTITDERRQIDGETDLLTSYVALGETLTGQIRVRDKADFTIKVKPYWTYPALRVESTL